MWSEINNESSSNGRSRGRKDIQDCLYRRCQPNIPHQFSEAFGVPPKFMWRFLSTVARTATVRQQYAALKCGKRFISTICIDPSIREFTSAITSKQPVFQLPPSAIRVLKEPCQFYTTLLVSRHHICLLELIWYHRIWSIKLNIESFSHPCTLAQKRGNSWVLTSTYYVNSFHHFPDISIETSTWG